MKAIAARLDATPAQVALAGCCGSKGVIAIPKAAHIQLVLEQIAARSNQVDDHGITDRSTGRSRQMVRFRHEEVAVEQHGTARVIHSFAIISR